MCWTAPLVLGLGRGPFVVSLGRWPLVMGCCRWPWGALLDVEISNKLGMSVDGRAWGSCWL
jgi:hypothetical protein